jgi:hypothetical protein
MSTEEVKTLVRRVNLIHLLLDHVLGENHTHAHRMSVGAIVMFIGMLLIHAFAGIEMEVVRVTVEVCGGFIHCVGSVPFVDYLINRANTK